MAAGDEYFEDLLKIEFTYSGERNTAANILYASCEAAHGASAADLVTAAETIGGYWENHIMPYVSDAVTFQNCYVSDWTSSDGLTGVYNYDTAGSLTDETLPAQVATLVNETSLLRYRGGRGRIYLPQATYAQLETDTTWTSGFISDVTDGVAAFFEETNELELGDDLLTLVLYHRAGSKVVEQGFEAIQGVACNPYPGTQRRRVRRVGHKR